MTVTDTVNGCTSLSQGLVLDDETNSVLGIDDVARFSSFCKDDIICSVNNVPVEDTDDFYEILRNVSPSVEKVTFSVERGEQLLE